MINRRSSARRDFVKSEAGRAAASCRWGCRPGHAVRHLPGPAGHLHHAFVQAEAGPELKRGLGKQIGIFGSILAGLRLSAVTGYLVLRRAKYR